MKKAVFLLHGEHQDTTVAEEFNGEELVVLVVADRGEISGVAQGMLGGLVSKAEKISSLLKASGKKVDVVLEWGPAKAALEACLQREQCPALNPSDGA